MSRRRFSSARAAAFQELAGAESVAVSDVVTEGIPRNREGALGRKVGLVTDARLGDLGNPALGAGLQCGHVLCGKVEAHCIVQERGGFVECEAQVIFTYLGHLAARCFQGESWDAALFRREQPALSG